MRLRATVAATLVVAAALGVSALVLVLALRGSLHDSAGAEAVRRAEAAVQVATTMAPGTAHPATPAYPHLVSSITLVDPDVRVVAGAEAAPTPATAERDGFVTATLPLPAGTAWQPALAVEARSSLAPSYDALATLNKLLLPGIPGLLAVVAAMTWHTVGRALAPVAAIRAKVAEITASDLHRRVPVPAARDEIAELALTVNATLDRLERAVGRHKRFVADAAHELRSPIATLRTRLELGATGPDRDLAREALVDVERLQSLTADLLLLARLDAAEPIPRAEVDLGQLAAEEALRARPRQDVRVRLDIAPDVVVHGSHGHLARLVVNLVDNAVRHAASTVTVRVAAEDGRAVLDVRDDGPGIPAEHRESVFCRFTRLDEARARDAGGSGLGLAIARDIATLHDGTLEVAGTPDDGPGALLRAAFPLPMFHVDPDRLLQPGRAAELPGEPGEQVGDPGPGAGMEAEEEAVGERHAPAHPAGDVVDPVHQPGAVGVREKPVLPAVPPAALRGQQVAHPVHLHGEPVAGPGEPVALHRPGGHAGQRAVRDQPAAAYVEHDPGDPLDRGLDDPGDLDERCAHRGVTS
ncbi:sensor histidine kinase [Thermocatellispora tengchongensis]|uniref:sensor histidine kinase n=1 Tax=Thermocatellispora tengchongensis TaxID=1073253 RepID=UPI00363E5834